MAAVALSEDRWLGARLGKPVFRLSIEPGAQISQATLHARTEEPRRCGGFVYAHVESSDVGANRALSTFGFVLVETSVELSRPMEFVGSGPGGWTVRRADPHDKSAVARLAYENFMISRFHADPLIADEAARAIKRDWVENYFSGRRGTDLLVSQNDGRVTGFLLLINDGGVLKIDLIAVAADAAGRGHASALVEAAATQFRGCHTMSVTTELSNTAALRLYTGKGFAIQGSRHVYHLHY